MKKFILVVFLLMSGAAYAESPTSVIAKSCNDRVPSNVVSECITLQVRCMNFVIENTGDSNSTSFQTVKRCYDAQPFEGDWLFIQSCYMMTLHNMMFGSGPNY